MLRVPYHNVPHHGYGSEGNHVPARRGNGSHLGQDDPLSLVVEQDIEAREEAGATEQKWRCIAPRHETGQGKVNAANADGDVGVVHDQRPTLYSRALPRWTARDIDAEIGGHPEGYHGYIGPVSSRKRYGR